MKAIISESSVYEALLAGWEVELDMDDGFVYAILSLNNEHKE